MLRSRQNGRIASFAKPGERKSLDGADIVMEANE
jgi:hypothetical protein